MSVVQFGTNLGKIYRKLDDSHIAQNDFFTMGHLNCTVYLDANLPILTIWVHLGASVTV